MRVRRKYEKTTVLLLKLHVGGNVTLLVDKISCLESNDIVSKINRGIKIHFFPYSETQ